MSEIDDSEEAEPHPPSASQVARRALVLAVVSCRAILELDPSRDQALQFWPRVERWWKGLGLSAELEPEERELLSTPFGGASRQALVNASWRSEGLSVLAWALGRVERVPHDEQVDPSVIATSLGFLGERTVLESPQLRPAAEIADYSSVAFTIHWRLREFSLRPGALDFAQFCQSAWFGPLSLNGVRLVEGDLALGGLPISRAPAQHAQVAMSIARERHQAANWLVDASLSYSETDTST